MSVKGMSPMRMMVKVVFMGAFWASWAAFVLVSSYGLSTTLLVVTLLHQPLHQLHQQQQQYLYQQQIHPAATSRSVRKLRWLGCSSTHPTTPGVPERARKRSPSGFIPATCTGSTWPIWCLRSSALLLRWRRILVHLIHPILEKGRGGAVAFSRIHF